MKKSIVALAVTSAAFASISAYAADTTTANFYGNIQYGFQDTKGGGKVFDNGSALGFNGESVIDDSTTAFFNIKYEVPLTEKGSYSVALDTAEVGVKGNFGKVRVGTFDGIYNDAVQDGIDNSENLSWDSNSVSPEGDTVAYYSPSMNGFEFQVSLQGSGSNNSVGSSGSGNSAMAVVKYSTDMFTVAAAYDARKNATTYVDKSTTGIKLTVAPMENVTLALNYESLQDTQKVTGLGATYGYGMGTIYAAVGHVSPNGSASSYGQSEIGANYSINSSMYVYLETGRSNSISTSNVGVVYSF